MITLTTGTPGAGKSLYTIDLINKKAVAEKREVYYFGIKDLMLPWFEMEDPKKWDELPIGAIIVIDECQTVFRPRANGAMVPAYIAAMETHRHKGYDIFLITQHPALLDQNIKRLVGQHIHVVRKFGLQATTVHEWGSTHEITQRNLLAAVRRQYRFTKEVYGYYKSAELHTHKAKIPKRVWFLLSVPLLIGVLIYFAMGAVNNLRKPQEATPVAKTETGAKVADGNRASGPVTVAAYIAEQQPRIAGMPWTAPLYDDLTRAVDVPTPMACMVNHDTDTCRCIDQQGNRMVTTEAFCRQFVQHGMFVQWRKVPENLPQLYREPRGQQPASEAASAPTSVPDGSSTNSNYPPPPKPLPLPIF